MTQRLGQPDLDDLSAYTDGELPEGRRAEVERLVRDDPAWREACRRMKAVDSLLDGWSVPEAPEGLADRVLTRIRRATGWARIVRAAAWVGSAAAAAAAILVAVAILNRPTAKEQPLPAPALGQAVQAELRESEAYRGVPQAERPALESEIVRHFTVLRGLCDEQETIEQFETLQAIEVLENKGT